jgi:excisionase family DNA binding protein
MGIAVCPEEFLTSRDVCALLKISSKTLERMRKRRALNFVRVGGAYRFRRSALDLFLAQREVMASPFVNRKAA